MNATDEIKSRLSIEQVVERYVDLKRSGASLKGLCPFHGEKTPSFYVTPAKGIYKCFGCGKSGDIFSFIQEMEQVDFPEALNRLAEQAGVALPDREHRTPSLKNRLFEANDAAMEFYRTSLSSAQGKRAREYLHKRGFDGTSVEAFDLGYAPTGRDVLAQSLRSRGFDDRTLLAAGLIFADEDGGQPRDRFRGRLIFPIRDAGARIVGFGGRALGDDNPKYLNSPQTEIFDKSGVLFGIHRSTPHIKESTRTVIVEGYFDAIRAQLSGFGDVVASLGTSITTKQLAAAFRLARTAVLVLDPDVAGRSAATRNAISALQQFSAVNTRGPNADAEYELLVAIAPEGSGDPDKMIRDHPERWQELIASAIPAFDAYYAHALQRFDRSDDAWKQKAIDELLPVVQKIAQPVMQAKWIHQLSRDTGVDFSLLSRSIPRRPTQPARGSVPSHTANNTSVAEMATRSFTLDEIDVVERSLLALLLKLLIVPNRAREALDLIQWHDDRYAGIARALIAWQERQSQDIESFRGTVPVPLAELVDELLADPSPLPPDHRLSAVVELHVYRARRAALLVEERRSREIVATLPKSEAQQALADAADLNRKRLDVDLALERLSKEVISGSRIASG